MGKCPTDPFWLVFEVLLGSKLAQYNQGNHLKSSVPIRSLSYYSMATRMPAVRRSCEDNARVVTVVHTSAALHYNVSGAKSRQYVSKCTNYRDCTVLSEQCTHAQLCTDSRTCHGRQYRPHIDAVRVICRDASQAELILP